MSNVFGSKHTESARCLAGANLQTTIYRHAIWA